MYQRNRSWNYVMETKLFDRMLRLFIAVKCILQLIENCNFNNKLSQFFYEFLKNIRQFQECKMKFSYHCEKILFTFLASW